MSLFSNFKIEFANEDLAFKNQFWVQFVSQMCQNQKLDSQVYRIVFDESKPTIYDSNSRKFKIDFNNDKQNYAKIKSGMRTEPLAKALGAGDKGLKVLDLSAGLGVDAIFLNQMGFQVTALERNPIVFMALKIASDFYNIETQNKIEFIHADALSFTKTLGQSQVFDLGYFDPMFPEKKKSALPKQEMVLFKNLVGQDLDAEALVQFVCENHFFKRFVVKRPLAAASFGRPQGSIKGKIIRYDIYS